MADTFNSLPGDEQKLLAKLREVRRARRAERGGFADLGNDVSDWVAATVGSWRFIIIQSVLLVIWMIFNAIGTWNHWDPYPFILLNLVLSFQAAYTAPIIMMSQNRQGEIDRMAAEHDYEVNVKAELEIELLHQKIDLLREREVTALIETIKALTDRLGLPAPAAAASTETTGARPDEFRPAS